MPADVRQPADYQRRVDDIVTYAESFFEREFERSGIETFVTPFAVQRTDKMTILRGKEPTSAYKPVSVRAEVMGDHRQQKRLTGAGQVW